jgi:hypothetical protein
MKPVYTPKNPREKKEQNIFFFWYKHENRGKIIAKLRKINREDLIEKFYSNKKSSFPGKPKQKNTINKFPRKKFKKRK